MSSPIITAYVALGANLGDRAANISAAVERLRETPGVEVVAVSALLENPAVGGPEGSPAFLNGVAAIRTTLRARELLRKLLEIEIDLGRKRREKWEPRVIDLDLLLYGEETIDKPDLQVPHPLMHTRRFVLEPLAQIAGNVRHPALGRTIAELLEELK